MNFDFSINYPSKFTKIDEATFDWSVHSVENYIICKKMKKKNVFLNKYFIKNMK